MDFLEFSFKVKTNILLTGEDIRVLYQNALKHEDCKCKATIRPKGLIHCVLVKFLNKYKISYSDATILFDTEEFDKHTIKFSFSFKNLILLSKIDSDFKSLIAFHDNKQKEINRRAR